MADYEYTNQACYYCGYVHAEQFQWHNVAPLL